MSDDPHSIVTEVELIVTQTFFYIVLFVLLKKTLIDKRGMLDSYERFNEDKLQIIAIYFAIIVFIALIMLSIHSYEFKHFVVPITFGIILCIIGMETRNVFRKGSGTFSSSPTSTILPTTSTGPSIFDDKGYDY